MNSLKGLNRALGAFPSCVCSQPLDFWPRHRPEWSLLSVYTSSLLAMKRSTCACASSQYIRTPQGQLHRCCSSFRAASRQVAARAEEQSEESKRLLGVLTDQEPEEIDKPDFWDSPKFDWLGKAMGLAVPAGIAALVLAGIVAAGTYNSGAECALNRLAWNT